MAQWMCCAVRVSPNTRAEGFTTAQSFDRPIICSRYYSRDTVLCNLKSFVAPPWSRRDRMEGDECWVQCDMCQKWRAIAPLEITSVTVGKKNNTQDHVPVMGLHPWSSSVKPLLVDDSWASAHDDIQALTHAWWCSRRITRGSAASSFQAHLAACATTGHCSSGGSKGRLLRGQGRTQQQQTRRLVYLRESCQPHDLRALPGQAVSPSSAPLCMQAVRAIQRAKRAQERAAGVSAVERYTPNPSLLHDCGEVKVARVIQGPTTALKLEQHSGLC